MTINIEGVIINQNPLTITVDDFEDPIVIDGIDVETGLGRQATVTIDIESGPSDDLTAPARPPQEADEYYDGRVEYEERGDGLPDSTWRHVKPSNRGAPR